VGGSRLREHTREKIEAVIRQLRAGESPKEVAASLRMSWPAVRQIIARHYEPRRTYIETYHLRHPQQSGPPPKILQPLIALKKASQL
jgi:hypothetical protein